MRRENYKSDLRIELTLEQGGKAIKVPDNDFEVRFMAGDNGRSYKCGRENGEWINCRPSSDGSKLICNLNHHGLGIGQLKAVFINHVIDGEMPDGELRQSVLTLLDIELVTGFGACGGVLGATISTDLTQAIIAALSAAKRAEQISNDLETKLKEGYFRGDKGDPGEIEVIEAYYEDKMFNRFFPAEYNEEDGVWHVTGPAYPSEKGVLYRNKKDGSVWYYNGNEYKLLIEKNNSGERGLTNAVDLTSVFDTGDADAINAALQANKDKLIYVGPGEYTVNSTIALKGLKEFRCYGNIVGPTNISSLKALHELPGWGDGVYRDEVSRAVVVFNSDEGGRCFIKKITVRHNYTGFYTYFCRGCDVEVQSIVGSYDTETVERFPSAINKNTQNAKTTFHYPIPDTWLLNAGFSGVRIVESNIKLGTISNLNFGLNFVHTIPTNNPDVSLYQHGINIRYSSLMCNKFMINLIDCKKAVNIDYTHRVLLNTSTFETTYTTSGYSNGAFIHGNEFNINSFDYLNGIQTNAIETFNTDFYSSYADSKRIMLNLLGFLGDKDPIASNVFNIVCIQGNYDVFVNMKNASKINLKGFLQVNDLYFNSYSSFMRTSQVTETSYYKGTTTGYEAVASVNVGPVMIFDNCHNISFENTGRAFLRENEISVASNCHNIYINAVGANNLNTYHSITADTYENVMAKIYDRGNYYYKRWNDGFLDSNGYPTSLKSGVNIKTVNSNSLIGSGDINIEGGSSSELTPTEINNSINTICV